MLFARRLVLLLVLAGTVGAGQPLFAQEKRAGLPPRATRWILPSTGLWRVARNPAGLPSAGLGERSRVAAGGTHEAGALRRPQEPGGDSEAALVAQGHRALGANHLMGRFRYGRRRTQDQEWANVADPYEGTPYVWADSAGGDWTRQRLNVDVAWGRPLGRRVRAGARVEYAVGQGARRSDPRPLYRRRRITAAPGVAFDLAERRTLGATGHFRWAREENEVGYFSSDDPFVYRLRGLSTYDYTQLVRGTRTNTGAEYGVAVQYAEKHAGWMAAVTLGARVGHERTTDGIAQPTFGGQYDTQSTHLRGRWERRGTPNGLAVELRGRLRRGQGTDPVFEAVNLRDRRERLGAAVEWWKGPERITAPLAVALGGGMRGIERRDQITETSWSTRAVAAALRVEGRAGITPALSFLWGANGTYRHPVAESFQPGRATLITNVLAAPDHARHVAQVVSARARGGGVYRLGPKSQVRLQAGVQMRRSVGSALQPLLGHSRHAFFLTLELLRQ